MSANSNPNENLSIPLEGALDKIKKDGTFNRNDHNVMGILIMLLLILSIRPLLAIRYGLGTDIWHKFAVYYGPVYALIILAIGYKIVHRINIVGKLRRFYDGHKTPQLTMDGHGVTIPAIMFLYKDKMLNYFIKTQNFSLTVPWSDIEAWKSLPVFEYRLTQTISMPVLELKVRKLPLNDAETITLQIGLLGEHVQAFTAFARRNLKVPFKELANSQITKDESFANLHPLRKIPIFIFFGGLAIFAIILLVGLMVGPPHSPH